MKSQLRQLTKADKLRRASKVAWVISTILSAVWIHKVVSLTFTNPLAAIAITVAVSAGFQYVISLVESALFDGSLPAPWSPDWSWEGSLPWLWGGAIVCLLVDVMLNLGGVSVFTSKISSGDIAASQLDVGDEFVVYVSRFATIILAVLFAVASELLDEFAIYSETGNSRSAGQRAKRQAQHIREQQQLEALLKQGGDQKRQDVPPRGEQRRDTKPNREQPFPGNGKREIDPADDLVVER